MTKEQVQLLKAAREYWGASGFVAIGEFENNDVPEFLEKLKRFESQPISKEKIKWRKRSLP